MIPGHTVSVQLLVIISGSLPPLEDELESCRDISEEYGCIRICAGGIERPNSWCLGGVASQKLKPMTVRMFWLSMIKKENPENFRLDCVD